MPPERGLRRVLVVDDSEDDVELLRVAFARGAPGWVVESAPAAEVVAAIVGAATPPDLVLLDWKMPGTSGAEVLAAIRRNPRLLGLPVFVFTSSDAVADVREAHALGCTGYLQKPPGMAEYVQLAKDVDGLWTRMLPRPPP